MDNLKLKDFLDYRYLSNLEMSPDKKYAAFTVQEADYEDNKYSSNIWVYNLISGEYQRLTSMNSENSFIWLDNNTILFPSMRDEKLKKNVDEGEQWTVYYAINIHGGEAQEYMRIPMSVSGIKIAGDDIFVITARYDHYGINLHSLTGEERSKAVSAIKDNKDYEVLDEIPFWSNGVGFTNKKRNRLYVYDKGSNCLTPLSDQFENTDLTDVKDGKALYTAQKFTNKKDQTNELYLYDIYSKELNCLVADDEYSVEYAVFVGDTIVFSGSLMDKYGLNQNSNFYKISDGNIELIAEHDYGMFNSVGSDCRLGGGESVRVCDDAIYFISTEAKCSFIKKLTLDGTMVNITADRGSVDCFDICDGEILFVGMRGINLQEMYSLKNGKETKITGFNDSVLETKHIVKPEAITFENDGVTIEGFVLKPVDYDGTKKYPGILDIHGGPKTVYGEVFFHEMQYWANEGYFVFFCNPRGSDGRGNEFADIRGKYGTIDYDDLMKFTDLVLEKYPAIDSARIGVTGGSYGGFMTNWIIGHTDRFKCAASQRSISNWISKFGTTDIGYYFNADQNQSTPWDNQEKLWWHSPLKYANQAVTPTLFIHSEEDYRCWLPEGLQMFTALKYHGVDARLCMFKGENHELSRSGKPKHRVRRLEEITNWFEKYLK